VHWASHGNCNFGWLTDHLKALIEEFSRRFDRIHSLSDTGIFDEAWFRIPHKPKESHPNLAYSSRHRLDFTHLEVPWSYRNYLNARWETTKPVWTRSTPPSWSIK
jgi:hypothetical protein